jgi:hypothetical protein
MTLSESHQATLVNAALLAHGRVPPERHDQA